MYINYFTVYIHINILAQQYKGSLNMSLYSQPIFTQSDFLENLNFYFMKTTMIPVYVNIAYKIDYTYA